MNLYYYFDKLPIYVTNNSCNKKTPTFLTNGQIWEGKMVEFFYDYLKEKSLTDALTVVDIGAQVGLYSLVAKYVPNTNFYAFEPYKPNRIELKMNLAFNNVTNVKVFSTAISDKKQTTTLQVCKSHNGLHTLSENPLRFKDVDRYAVKTDTLDALFYDKKITVDVIKIDTEGWEYYILQGGLKTIRQDHPDILMEYNPLNMKQCNVTPTQIDEFMQKENYHLQKQIGEERWYRHHSKLLIYVDVGAHKGKTCIPFLENGYIVHAFEPNPELFNTHLQPLQTKHALLNIVQKAIDVKEGQREFYITNNDECSSLKEIVYDAKKWNKQNQFELEISKKIQVNCTRLDTYLLKNNISHINCLKIDAQGSNLEALQSLGKFIQKCDIIKIETQLENEDVFYKKESKQAIVLEWMVKYNFLLMNIQRYPSNLFVDLVFKRNGI